MGLLLPDQDTRDGPPRHPAVNPKTRFSLPKEKAAGIAAVGNSSPRKHHQPVAPTYKLVIARLRLMDDTTFAANSSPRAWRLLLILMSCKSPGHEALRVHAVALKILILGIWNVMCITEKTLLALGLVRPTGKGPLAIGGSRIGLDCVGTGLRPLDNDREPDDRESDMKQSEKFAPSRDRAAYGNATHRQNFLFLSSIVRSQGQQQRRPDMHILVPIRIWEGGYERPA
ncbi:hypothetical protein MKZ38_007363 [Zalerion maritima]|uniref:Uncharacterized protein n=1 Tax=Zalerion maritima TaxID=339359 RepID=A0AAD5RV24_9PEZI|nr:hypothetical protein MKZ38_007363 [Zalerion maritima]